MSQSFSFDRHGFLIDGKRTFLISGEVPYFRVPKRDWEPRLRLLCKSGANCLATYIPWCIHEPTDGRLLFDDCEERDLSDFLALAGKLGLKVLLRPGPYQYAELTGDGIPEWLWENYPDTRAKRPDGRDFESGIPVFSYLSPTFLARAKRYLSAVCRVIRPYLAAVGGPVVMLQLDNELAGVHLWRGSPDCNPSALGIGVPGGRYPSFLARRYGTVEALNAAYGSAYTDFASVRPTGQAAVDDCFECYRLSLGDYAEILRDHLRSEGVTEPVCHNAASPGFVPLFREFNRRLGSGFLLGLDSYFQLTWGSGRLAPTPGYLAGSIQLGADLLEEAGNPYTVLEMQSGSYADTPPLLPRPLEAHLMAHLAMGLRGVNYYIFAGGNRSGAYGTTADCYDYHAAVGANGEKRPNLRVLRRFSRLMKRNAWLCEADRVHTVCVGVDSTLLSGDQNPLHAASGSLSRLLHGLMYTLMSTPYPSRYTDLSDRIRTKLPLLVCHPALLSHAAQENLVRFVRGGGKLILIGGIPAAHTPLASLVGVETAPHDSHVPVMRFGNRSLYGIKSQYRILSPLPGDRVILTDPTGQSLYGIRGRRGDGELFFLCAEWDAGLSDQRDLLAGLLEAAGAEPVLSCSEPAVCTAIRRGKDRDAIFLINLHHGTLRTSVTRYENGKAVPLGRFSLKPLEVRMLVRRHRPQKNP